MAKYFFTFVLLAFLALENQLIYNRLHAKSHPSGSNTNTVTHFMRQHQYQYRQHHSASTHNRLYPTHKQHQAHHARKHIEQHQKHNFDQGQEEDEPIQDSRRDVERFKRHMEHQRQHRLEHNKRLQERYHRPTYSAETLKTMPRIWQHLSTMYDSDYEDEKDRMYGDEPMEEEDIVLETDESNIKIEIPLELDDENEDEKKVQEEEEHNHKAGVHCPKCESNRKVEHVTEEELTRLRIEFVKQQILEKLRLKERPNVSAVGLPKPIYEGVTIEQEEDATVNKDLDDYYARTSKKFIFLEVEKHECRKLGSQPSMCFSFKIDDADADGYDVSTAVLWLFKNNHQKMIRNDTILTQQTIVVSEVQQQLDSKYIPIVKTIAIQSVDVQDEWMKIDIEWPIKRWFGNHELSHLIQITCQSCDIESMEHMISTHKDYRPFIMVDTQNRKRQPRQKREINCTDGVTECCREKLYISFDEIGWGDWIIQPRGYDAYFCRGTCGMVASISESLSAHNTVLQKLLNKPGRRRKNLELVPCCTAKQYSSLQLVFMDTNNTATQKTFPNMVVESCGCR
ncbi:activin beta chain dawdle isoform 1-T2 [Cochliomyia hominivorax]